MDLEKKTFICCFNQCNKYFEDPVLLPCGNNICKEHVDELIKNEVNLECSFCNTTHQISSDEMFNLNLKFREILNLNFHLKENEKKAKRLLDQLKSNANEFKIVVQDPENFIYDYISNIRNKIDEERERLIEAVHLISNEMLNQLRDYENECRENMKNMNDQHKSNENYLSNLNDKISSWKYILRKPDTNSDQTDTIVENISKSIDENQMKLSEYKNSLLKNKFCSFSSRNLQIEKDIFGTFLIGDSADIDLAAKNAETSLLDSSILSSSQSVDLLNLCEFNFKNTQFNLLYRGTRDGFSSHNFHEKCDKLSRTLTVVKSKDGLNIFGGYTEATWDGFGYKNDNKAFIFSLINKDNQPLKIRVFNPYEAIYCGSTCGPTFGKGNDLKIANESNVNNNSNSQLGKTYKHFRYNFNSAQAQSFLAGARNFMTSEIEVFQVI